jgi:hypothetical protein
LPASAPAAAESHSCVSFSAMGITLARSGAALSWLAHLLLLLGQRSLSHVPEHFWHP